MQLFDERSSPDIHLIYNPPPPQPAIYDTPSRRHQPRPKKPKPDGRLPPHHHQAPFRLEAQGTLGSSAMDFPDEREIIDTLEWQDEALDELFVRRRHARFEMSNRGGGGMDVDDEDEAGQDGGRGKMSIRFGCVPLPSPGYSESDEADPSDAGTSSPILQRSSLPCWRPTRW